MRNQVTAAAFCMVMCASPASAADLIRYDFTGVGTGCTNGCRIQDGTSSANASGYFILDPSQVVTSASGSQNFYLTYVDPLIGRSEVSASFFDNVLSFGYFATDPSAVRYRYNVSITFAPGQTGFSSAVGFSDILSSAYSASLGANFISGGLFESQSGSLVNFRAATVTSANDRYARFTTAQGVPEPSTWAMMLLGFGTIGGAFRLRRTKKLSSALT